jgi:hypothetical protein
MLGPGAIRTTGGGDLTEGRLVVPERLVIDEVARERLTRQLDRLPAEVKGVAAEVGELPPGASYRVEAEWRSLEPLSGCVASTAPVRGAVLLRPNVRFEVSDGLVGVDGSFVIDRGAHVHDPWTPLGSLLAASERGRPPFPRRPVVVFAATEIDPAVADWARRMVNRLVRREVEGRLALPAADDGLHLTRPCLSGAESIRALTPDVIVTLDRGAAAAAAEWCHSDRSTVIIELVDEPAITERLVSWQIEHARGRVRAQISSRVGAPSLARLVGRLCAGPHPAPPTDAAADLAGSRQAVRESWRTQAAARPTCVVVTGMPSPAAAARLVGLVDQLEASGVGVAQVSQEHGIPPGAATATLVVLVGAHGSAAVTELLEQRAAAGGATVLDVDPSAVSASKDGSSVPAVAAQVVQLAIDCGYVLTPTEAVRTALRELPIRSLVIPAMLTRPRAAALRTAGVAPEPREGAAVGWYVGSAGEAVGDYLDAVAQGIAKVLADRGDVRVDVVGDEDGLPAALRRHRQVSVTSSPPDPQTLAGWALHVWTPRLVCGELVDDLGKLIEASFAGVPSVLPLPARRAMGGVAGNDFVVSRYEEPEGWATALSRLLGDDGKRTLGAHEARRWSHTVHGSPACRASVNRLLGWARYQGES